MIPATHSAESSERVQREKRYEPRERARIQALERAILRERATKEAEERDRVEMRSRLAVWDDDESDEMFYTDRYVPLPILASKLSHSNLQSTMAIYAL